MLITGPVGIGKTALLRALQRCAVEAGWRLAPDGGQHVLAAGWNTTPTSFAMALRRTLDEPYEEPDPATGIAAALVEEAPLLVAVELYRPSGAFLAWLERDLMPELRAHDAAIVLVTTSTQDERHLEATADAVVRLGVLDSDAVRAALDGLTLDPPLDEAERAVYVEEASRSPAVLAGLLRVLSLTAVENSA